MPGSTFQTNPIDLDKLLDDCHRGTLQLPDFQRSWVWDEERIKSLIASISRAFPIGALMSLDTGGPVNFKPRPVEGAPVEAKQAVPRSLNAPGEGDPEMDAGTIHVNVMRISNGTATGRRQWQLICIVCFAEPNIDGPYAFSEADYSEMLKLAPNIQYAFEAVDERFSEARKELRRKIDDEKKRLAEINRQYP
jgi:hypothetical protein